MEVPCAICGSTAAEGDDNGWIMYRCPRCGAYRVESGALSDLVYAISKSQLNPSALSHQLRSHFHANPRLPFDFSRDVLAAFIRDGGTPPTPQGQFDNFIVWMGNSQEGQSRNAVEKKKALAALVGAEISKSGDEPNLDWMINQTRDTRHPDGLPNLYEVRTGGAGDELAFRLTLSGWRRYEDLKRIQKRTRKAFFARQFDDSVLRDYVVPTFKKAVERAGFDLIDLETVHQPAGHIDDQIRAAIRTARFVIADLTHNNRGAYFEAGFAEGLGIPVIYSCEEDAFNEPPPNGPHFDTRQLRTILWKQDTLQEASNRLTATIRVTLVGEARMED